MSSRRLGALALATALSSAARAVPTATAATDGSAAVISEVYGGGGNKGAAFTHDFIELYNPTDAPIDLTGYLSLIHISEPTRLSLVSRMPSSA